MALVLISVPILGALSDQAGRRLPFLMVCTVACVLCTAALGLGGLWGTLAVFVVANYFFQASLIIYDATLPAVSTKRTRGVVGGFGIGVGYLGSFIAVLIALFLVDTIGEVGAFRVTALVFAILAVPIFLFVKEPQVRAKLSVDFGAARCGALAVAATSVGLCARHGMRRTVE